MGDKQIGIGLVGAGWMGNEHSQAYRRIPEVWPDAGFRPVLAHVADSVPSIAEANARRWGYAQWSPDWRSVVEDPAVDVVDVTGPNAIHHQVAVAAAAAGKHVSCEKPLGRTAAEAADMADAVRRAGVLSNCNFEYRYNPAVEHAYNLVSSGKLGRMTHVRGLYLCDYGCSPDGPFSWRFDREVAGWGALGDIGSHTVDMLEMLNGPVTEVVGVCATFVTSRASATFTDQERLAGATLFARPATAPTQRTEVTNEDYACALLRFDGGAVGTLEVSRASDGPKDSLRVAAHGSLGAFEWDSERMNEIQIHLASADETNDGFRRVLMGPMHPWYGRFCPGAGSGLGWHDMTVISLYQFLRGIVDGRSTPTDFKRGAHVAAVLDAIQLSWQSRLWTSVAPTASPPLA